MAEIFNLTFPSDLSEFDGTVIDGGDLFWDSGLIAGASGRVGVLIDDTTAIYGYTTFTQFTSETDLFVRIYMQSLLSLSMGSSDLFELAQFRENSAGETTKVYVYLFANYGSRQIGIQGRNDAGAFTSQMFATISTLNYIQIHAHRASSNVANDGYIDLYFDDTKQGSGLTGIDNYDTFRFFKVLVGAVASLDVGTSGTWYFGRMKGTDSATPIGASSVSTAPSLTVPGSQVGTFFYVTALVDDVSVTAETANVTVAMTTQTNMSMSVNVYGDAEVIGNGTHILQVSGPVADVNLVLSLIHLYSDTLAAWTQSNTITITALDGLGLEDEKFIDIDWSTDSGIDTGAIEATGTPAQLFDFLSYGIDITPATGSVEPIPVWFYAEVNSSPVLFAEALFSIAVEGEPPEPPTPPSSGESAIAIFISGLPGIFGNRVGLTKIETLEFKQELHTRGECQFQLISESPSQTFYRPSIGATVLIEYNNTIMWGGAIDRVNSYQEKGLPTVLFQNIECVTFEQLFDRHLISNAYEELPLRNIVIDIIDRTMEAEGINTDNVEDGPTIAKIVFNFTSVTQAMNELAELTGYTWWIQINGVRRDLYFVAIGTRNAPFDITDKNQVETFQVTQERGDYRNIQYLRAGSDETDFRTESFKGDGTNRTFVLAYPLSEISSITVNGVAQTYGIRGVEIEGTKQFYYQIGSENITHDPDETVLDSSKTVAVYYRGSFPLLLIAQDGNGIVERQAVEGGDGIYENIQENQNVNRGDWAVELLSGILRRKSILRKTINFSLREFGLMPGQIITVNLSEYGINEALLIVSVNWRSTSFVPQTFLFEVEAVSGEAFGGWAEFWNNLYYRGRTISSRENEVATPITYTLERMGLTESLTIEQIADPCGVIDVSEIGMFEVCTF